MDLNRRNQITGRHGRAATIVAALLLTLSASPTVHAQSPGDSSEPVPGLAAANVLSPTTDLLADTITRSLNTAQTSALTLATPQAVPGQPLSISGAVYLPNGSAPLVDQKLAYKDGGMSFNFGYRSVGKDVTEADLLGYRTGQDANLPDALNQLLSQRGQNDLNAELGLAGSQGFKLDYKFDAQTNSLSDNRSVNQSLLFEKDAHASAFSFLHSVASTDGASSSGLTTATDELKYAYTPGSGLKFTGDASTSHGGGKDDSQWRADLSGQIAPALTLTGFYHHEMVAAQQTNTREEFDGILKSGQIHNLQLMAEFARSQQIAQQAEAKRCLQATLALPHFIGVNSAKWVVGLTEQTIEDQALRRDLTVGFESQVPGSYRAVPGLTGATLHLEFAGNSIGATPIGSTANTPRRLHATTMHSRLLRLVSAPQTSKWLSWSVAQQTHAGNQGTMLPVMRDYEIKGVVSPSLSFAYSDRDQLPQDDGSLRDTKEQKLSVTVSRPHSAQIVAEYVHGADMSNNVSQQSSLSFGYTGPVTSDQTMSLSLGTSQRTSVGGSPQTGATCKTAFDWHQDAKNLLGFNGALTVWNHQGTAKADSIDAAAHLNFERLY